MWRQGPQRQQGQPSMHMRPSAARGQFQEERPVAEGPQLGGVWFRPSVSKAGGVQLHRGVVHRGVHRASSPLPCCGHAQFLGGLRPSTCIACSCTSAGSSQACIPWWFMVQLTPICPKHYASFQTHAHTCIPGCAQQPIVATLLLCPPRTPPTRQACATWATPATSAPRCRCWAPSRCSARRCMRWSRGWWAAPTLWHSSGG